ncbi:MAG: hypothetical protein F4230_06620 [Holophagales bacterium]|nr:hypothetical protein [Holophagales bacterium]
MLAASGTGACIESDTVLCLHEGRYEVMVEFAANGETMSAKVARPRTRDSGLFYFFEPNNWEMLLKVLDGCGENQHHWVFAATASDVGIRLVVRDTTLPDDLVNLKEYEFPPIARRPQGADESDDDYEQDVLAKGHPALTEVGASRDPSGSSRLGCGRGGVYGSTGPWAGIDSSISQGAASGTPQRAMTWVMPMRLR